MPIKIFDLDPTTQPKTKQKEDLVGRFRAGYQANGYPVSIDKWRITTGDPEVADVIADLYGGKVSEWDTKSEEKLEVFTDAASIAVIVEPTGFRAEMVLWGRKGKIRTCDGVAQKDGEPCVCPSALAELKKAASNGSACEPSTSLYFRLVDAPELGKFSYHSSGWTIARDAGRIESALMSIGGPALVRFGLEKVTKKDGETFVKPVVDIVGAWEEA